MLDYSWECVGPFVVVVVVDVVAVAVVGADEVGNDDIQVKLSIDLVLNNIPKRKERMVANVQIQQQQGLDVSSPPTKCYYCSMVPDKVD